MNLEKDLREAEQKLRHVSEETDILQFNNERLTKRISVLQDELAAVITNNFNYFIFWLSLYFNFFICYDLIFLMFIFLYKIINIYEIRNQRKEDGDGEARQETSQRKLKNSTSFVLNWKKKLERMVITFGLLYKYCFYFIIIFFLTFVLAQLHVEKRDLEEDIKQAIQVINFLFIIFFYFLLFLFGKFIILVIIIFIFKVAF